MFRRVEVVVASTTALALVLGLGLPVAAGEVASGGEEGVSADPPLLRSGLDEERPRHGEYSKKRAADAAAPVQLTQFQLPQPGLGQEARPLPQNLRYQYAIGTESDVTYRRDRDLNKRVRDNSLVLAPQLSGYLTYRPNNWLEATLEMVLERPIAAHEEKRIILPSGETQFAEKRRFSLVAEQAFLRFKNLAGPFEFLIGRRNFEDDRRWLYDTALDGVIVRLRQGSFQAEASASREDLVDLDLLKRVKPGRIDNYMLYMDYRGIEDHKLAAYAILRHDSSGHEGSPLLLGVRAYGRPSDRFNYWTELPFLRGRDQLNRKFSARAFDVGGTYRFIDLPLQPNVTLAYAFGTGDGNPNDNKDTEFRQTGLQSNEQRFGGITQFKRYGEALDPELSNVKIFSVGFGFRPASSVFVDLVYHRYRLHKIADEIRNSAVTAQMAQVDTHLSRDVGRAFDVVLGFRNIFGLRRLGLDLRAGWFFPGNAFLRNDGDEENPNIRRADKGVSILAKFLW